ncbi:hypothetical protein BDD12DRAFT_915076 [Trichophaea hybrida]|nr:hypothetical protein BDD12DRAFT_915076 [Trichophaea hybrida]
MDITFITMHDLSPDATVLYASESIGDVLGYQAEDVVGQSCFRYFHPDETPFAKAVHGRGVHLDRAAMLSYCNLKRTDGTYVRCECVFTVVYTVIVACTSLYRYTDKSQGRAVAAPAIRRAFSSSAHDPRYHMLTHLSSKFTAQPEGNHEPRAALILNRFTRTLAIMYATHTISDILGIQAQDAIGRSFYECISEDCLQDAVDALERAKENDSIAYLRFLWRDPRAARARSGSPGARPDSAPVSNDGAEASSNIDSVDGGVPLPDGTLNDASVSERDSSEEDDPSPRRNSTPQSSVSGNAGADHVIEVEAVVSCTSDGLVVIVRKAHGTSPLSPERGIFASPWSHTPLMPDRPSAGTSPFAPDFMDSIQQVAVFAWSLRSINGEIMAHALPETEEGDEEPDGKGKSKAKTKDPQYPGEGRGGDDMHSNKRRAKGD